ncbi:MAG: AtpZ/AtpI family protein [bacterium]|nr:AtpZ/AtpI family protein [bacterium]
MRGRPVPRLRYLAALPVTVFLGFLAGRRVDAFLGTAPWLALLGVVAGAGAGLLVFIQEVDPDLFRR